MHLSAKCWIVYFQIWSEKSSGHPALSEQRPAWFCSNGSSVGFCSSVPWLIIRSLLSRSLNLLTWHVCSRFSFSELDMLEPAFGHRQNVVSVRPANIYNITNEPVKFILRRCEQLDRIKWQSWECCRVHFDVAVTLLALRPERRLHQMYDITLRSYRNSQLLSLTISLKISKYKEIILTLLSYAVWRYGRDRRTVSRHIRMWCWVLKWTLHQLYSRALSGSHSIQESSWECYRNFVVSNFVIS